MKKLLQFSFAFLLPIFVFGQSPSQREAIIKQTNVEALQAIVDQQNKLEWQKDRHPNTIQIEGQTAYLATIDENGTPRYVVPNNKNAAISIKVDKIRVGGSSGYDLDGTGINVGVWEAGGVPLVDHVEFGGNAEIIDLDAEATFHATHVTGTIIAAGLNPNAEGMAPGAKAFCSDSNNDIAELAEYAMDGGLMTNHSYGTILHPGNVSLLGVYTTAASTWDKLLYNSPYLVSCKSAGNTRNNGFNLLDNGYDQLLNASCAKNNIVVGAIDDVITLDSPTDFVESSFSSWGPTDDWRIKPDITANGVNLFSCTNQSITSYSNSSGTSMSVATVTGAIALLQEFYQSIYGTFMKSATVKALMIATADELGPHEGPDFREGWGLFNALEAANTINDNGNTTLISEEVLDNSSTYEWQVFLEAGNDVSITIAWSDPANNLTNQGENIVPSLVNDLDLRLIGEDDTFMPWAMVPDLFPTNFDSPAQQVDNIRDNVERINATITTSGLYRVRVSHKGELENGTQPYSIVMRGIESKSVSVLDIKDEADISIYPNPSADYINIAWQNPMNGEHNIIQLINIDGKIILDTTSDSSSLKLDVSALPNSIYTVRVSNGTQVYTSEVVINR